MKWGFDADTDHPWADPRQPPTTPTIDDTRAAVDELLELLDKAIDNDDDCWLGTDHQIEDAAHRAALTYYATGGTDPEVAANVLAVAAKIQLRYYV